MRAPQALILFNFIVKAPLFQLSLENVTPQSYPTLPPTAQTDHGIDDLGIVPHGGACNKLWRLKKGRTQIYKLAHSVTHAFVTHTNYDKK